MSAPSIARLKAGWQAEYELWKGRSVADLEVVYLWVDGIYVKAGLQAGSLRAGVGILSSTDARLRGAKRTGGCCAGRAVSCSREI